MSISYEILRPIHTNAEAFAGRVFNSLSVGTLAILEACIGLWVVWKVIDLITGRESVPNVIRPLLVFPCIMTINQAFFWEHVYRPLQDSGAALLGLIATAGNHGQRVNNLEGMFTVVESSFLIIFHFAQNLCSSGGYTNMVPIVLAFFITIPYIILWAIFIVYTIRFVLTLLAISSLSPLFILAGGFDSTRGYAIAALKVVLQSLLTVCISVISMGILLLAIQNASNTMGLNNDNSQSLSALATLCGNSCMLIVLGIIAIIFQFDAASIASSILGAQGSGGDLGYKVKNAVLTSVKNTAIVGSRTPQVMNEAATRIRNRLRGENS